MHCIGIHNHSHNTNFVHCIYKTKLTTVLQLYLVYYTHSIGSPRWDRRCLAEVNKKKVRTKVTPRSGFGFALGQPCFANSY